MRWSEQEFADYVKKRGERAPPLAHASPIDVSNPPFKMPPNKAGRFALGRLPVGAMNKTEAAYDKHLAERAHAGEIIWHKFEGIKLRLADNTFLTVDFMVLPVSGFLEAHEVKGFWEDDARVKIKIAASLYPFKFIAVTPRAKKHGGGYSVEEF